VLHKTEIQLQFRTLKFHTRCLYWNVIQPKSKEIFRLQFFVHSVYKESYHFLVGTFLMRQNAVSSKDTPQPRARRLTTATEILFPPRDRARGISERQRCPPLLITRLHQTRPTEHLMPSVCTAVASHLLYLPSSKHKNFIATFYTKKNRTYFQ
jgi:hypothetical protein